MNKCTLKIFEPYFIEYLGRIYNQNAEYRKNIEREIRAEKILEENFTKKQMLLIEQYHAAVCSTMGICELLCYKQGMKDLAAMLDIKNIGQQNKKQFKQQVRKLKSIQNRQHKCKTLSKLLRMVWLLFVANVT